jgi:integral membrane protein
MLTKNLLLQIFRKIAYAEGASYLLLLCVAMPLKYMADYPVAVDVAGWLHGILFIVYIVTLIIVQLKLKWSFKKFFLAGVASLLPFGPFIFDKKMLVNESVPQQNY